MSLKIDKGIRSSNLGDQVESIVFYAHLIKYRPTPLVISSIIIKLADIFRTSSNQVKYRILKVFQECSSEIHRISNIDEVLKRIHSVILSNDPVARALALRVLGSVPQLIADKLYIHHSVRASMLNHDQVEADATLFVMERLCAIAPVFSDSVLEKIHSIVQAVETPPLTKLKYMRLFRHMHHNHLISNQSREMLIGLLSLYPSVVFVTVILDTLTDLALKHILYMNDHITFLIKYALNDPRIKVKVAALTCLQKLARESPHSIYPFGDIFGIVRDQPQRVTELLLPMVDEMFASDQRHWWAAYLMAQQAQKHGFHSIASTIYTRLLTRVESECNYFWLKALQTLSSIEHDMAMASTTRSLLIARLNSTVVAFKASAIHEKSLSFQESFIKLRSRYIHALSTLRLFLIENKARHNESRVEQRILALQHLAKEFTSLLSRGGKIEASLWRESKPIMESYGNAYQSTSTSSPLSMVCQFIEKQQESLTTAMDNNSQSRVDRICDVVEALLSVPASYPSIFFTVFK
eukprot:gene7035-8179_t